MKIALAIILSLAAMSGPGFAQQSAGSADGTDAVTSALATLRAGDMAGAQRHLDAVIAGYEKRYAGEKRMIFCGFDPAETLLYMAAATAAKHDAIAIEPGWCMGLWAKGYAFAEAKQYDQAIAYLQRAIDKAPHHPQFLAEIGYAYNQSGQWQKAIDAYNQVDANADLSGDTANHWKGVALRGIGFARIELRQWDAAETSFKQALVLDPEDANAKSELAYIAANRDRE